MYTARITCPDEALYEAFKPEETKSKRLELHILKGENQVEILVTAQDATAFKAMMTSITRLLETAEKINHGNKK